MILAAERPKHPRSGRPVCVHPEPGRGLGPDRSLAVVPRRDLDVDASAPPVGVGVLDLRIGVEHASLLVDGEAELSGDTVPLGVGGPATVSRARGLAPARDSALELAVEPYAPDGGAPLEQALAFAAAGPVDGRVRARARRVGGGERRTLCAVRGPGRARRPGRGWRPLPCW